MSLYYKSAKVPEKEDEIRELLGEMADKINNMSSDCATGDLSFLPVRPGADAGGWQIEVNGSISYGQNNNGKEIWKPPELQDCYSGKTLKEAVEQLLIDITLHYGDKLP